MRTETPPVGTSCLDALGGQLMLGHSDQTLYSSCSLRLTPREHQQFRPEYRHATLL